MYSSATRKSFDKTDVGLSDPELLVGAGKSEQDGLTIDDALQDPYESPPDDLRLDLVRDSISYRDAVYSEDDILKQLSYPAERLKSCAYLIEKSKALADLVAFHLCIEPQRCEVADPKEWTHGSFNWFIPIRLNWKSRHTVVLRIPLPYKFGNDSQRMDEKTSCEAATHIVMERRCPDVPTAKLWGFGLSDGKAFTRPENVSFLSRVVFLLQNAFRVVVKRSEPSQYVVRKERSGLGLSYLIVDYIEGELLSESFQNELHNKTLQTNLFTDLSRMMLSIANVQHARIGSFTIDDSGVVSLSNRPLTLRIPILESDCLPQLIPLSKTYESTETYILDMLSYHDSRILHQPNSINDERDAKEQMKTLCLMRAILPHCILAEARNGPFTLTLTDVHPGNIFVDQNWRVKALIDLEGAGVLPSEMTQPPYWITGKNLDSLVDDNLVEFECRRSEFMSIFARIESEMFPDRDNSKTKIMERSWRIGASWYLTAIQSNGLYHVFHQHIREIFGPPEESWRYWGRNAADTIRAKQQDRNAYLQQLRKVAIQTWKSH